MATINDISIRALKSYMGMEGIAYQGVVYRKDTELGFWSQDGFGGPDHYEFDMRSLLDDAVNDFKDGLDDPNKDCYDADVLLGTVLRLTNIEKTCRSYFRDGYKAVVFVTDGYKNTFIALPDDLSNEELLKKYEEDIREAEQKLGKRRQNFFGVNIPAKALLRPDSFDLTVDKTHPAPDYIRA